MEAGGFFVGGYYGAAASGDFSPEKRMSVEQKLADNFTVDDLLDFSNEDAIINDCFLDNLAGNSTDSSTVTCNSSVSGGDNQFSSAVFPHTSQFSSELCVPVINQTYSPLILFPILHGIIKILREIT